MERYDRRRTEKEERREGKERKAGKGKNVPLSLITV